MFRVRFSILAFCKKIKIKKRGSISRAKNENKILSRHQIGAKIPWYYWVTRGFPRCCQWLQNFDEHEKEPSGIWLWKFLSLQGCAFATQYWICFVLKSFPHVGVDLTCPKRPNMDSVWKEYKISRNLIVELLASAISVQLSKTLTFATCSGFDSRSWLFAKK